MRGYYGICIFAVLLAVSILASKDENIIKSSPSLSSSSSSSSSEATSPQRDVIIAGDLENKTSANNNESQHHRQLYNIYSKSIAAGITIDSTLSLQYDPPNGSTSVTGLAVYVWSNNLNARIYYTNDSTSPSLNSSYVDASAPYIQVTSPYKETRNRTLIIVAVVYNGKGGYTRSHEYQLRYYVESSSRPNSYGYLIPGVDSNGYFVQFGIEVAASARPQSAANQEFSDFYTNLGVGTYSTQIQALHLPSIDSDLCGFEGGFTYNSSGNYYGVLIPYHTGTKFFGKVVRINLKKMANATQCGESYVTEYMDASGNVMYNGTSTVDAACVHIMDLSSVDPQAVGLRRGFVGYPYGYLSSATYQVNVRINLETFSLNSTRFVDLSKVNFQYSGFSGGFADGDWACFW